MKIPPTTVGAVRLSTIIQTDASSCIALNNEEREEKLHGSGLHAASGRMRVLLSTPVLLSSPIGGVMHWTIQRGSKIDSLTVIRPIPVRLQQRAVNYVVAEAEPFKISVVGDNVLDACTKLRHKIADVFTRHLIDMSEYVRDDAKENICHDTH